MAKFFRNLFILLWRVWFYTLVLTFIVVFFPLLLLFTSREEWYRYSFAMARLWSKFVLYGSGFLPIITRESTIDRSKSYMFVANHTSLTDIFLMFYCVKNPFVFVGKKELVKIPIFGFFYKRTCILVDRGSQKSRTEVFEQAQKRIQQGNSICIFPEGGVPDDESIVLDTFKDGAFRLAIEHQLPILPITFIDNKKRFSYTFFSGGPGKMRAIIHKELVTTGLNVSDKRALREQTRTLILKHLMQYN